MLPADRPDEEFAVFEPRRQGIEYSVDHDQGDSSGAREPRFLIVTNDGAEDFRLMEAPDATPSRAAWQEVIPARKGVRLDGVEPFAATWSSTSARRARPGSASSTRRPSPRGRSASPSRRRRSGAGPIPSTTRRCSATSTPRSSRRARSTTCRSQGATPCSASASRCWADFDPGDYRTERRWARAGDGTEVPISLVYRPDLVAQPGVGPPSPCLLYGYGSYEASMDPTFSSLRLSLLDRGLVFAIAHVRGGGEMGRRWYEEGKLAAKPTTFTDFLACAGSLVAEGWTTPAQLVARGGSAGGLLMGAVANLAPELFRAIVAEVPFVDCLTTIMDESLPLTVTEWEEWGNPVADPEIYRVMKSYSPYDNVRSGDDQGMPVRYPDILATAGLTDPRVGYWEPAKWVAKLRAANPDNRVLLRTELGAGHGGPSGRYDAWKEEAFVYAFVLDALGIADSAPVPPPSAAGSAG